MSMLNMMKLRASQARLLMRTTPFDTSTEGGRTQERYRRLAHAAAAQMGAKAVAVLTALVSVPLTVNYLGPERYGLWLTISSFITMLGFADLGLGHGLLTGVAEAHGKDDSALARRYISSALAMLGGMGTLVIVLSAAAYPLTPWGRVFNVDTPQAIAEAGPAMAIMLVSFALSMPMGLVSRVQLGYQQGVAVSLWAMLTNLSQLGALLLVVHYKGGLPWLVLAMVGAPAVVTLLNWGVLFGWQKPELRPRLGDVHRDSAKRLLRTGVMFLILSVCAAMAFTSDNLVIARELGTQAVTDYGVPMKLFSIVTMVLGVALAPLWPAYGEAATRGDVRWVKKTLVRSVAMTLALGGGACLVLVVLGRPLIHLWVRNNEINPGYWLLAGMGVWTVLSGLGTCIAMFYNGCNRLKGQVICGVVLAVVGLGAKIVGARLFGSEGVIWGTVTAYLFTVLIPLLILLPRTLRTVEKHAPSPTETLLVEEAAAA